MKAFMSTPPPAIYGLFRDSKYRNALILKDCTVCIYSKEELTSRGDSTFLYTSYISRKKFMAEIRKEHIQNHLEERESINSKTTQDRTPKTTIPFICILNITQGSFN